MHVIKMFKVDVARAVCPRLIPFINGTILYFLLRPEPSWLAIACKCLPILCLCGFVIHEIYLFCKQGFSVFPKYHLAILTGLVLSCIGDGCLVYVNQYFIHGLLFFALAHVMYIFAFSFGTNPIKPSILVPLMPFAGVVYGFLYPGFAAYELTFLGALYIILIMLMLWRAIARVQFAENLWTWTKMAAGIGAVLFCISDLVLATNMFRSAIPSSQSIVMTTYYTAQLGMAMSVVSHGHVIEKKEK
ncbi:lysoplasmalogenase-like protein TMEM86A [Lytechinus variegatus]|uniref:lysoplasmalogenase-like protein TMEM86A n=1 Tax=Lytechinus variegatus TaxID=7654 RepID=UPI001BB156DC|nr:lysoplasmalogenase-like protein TMEM86A [Lytechinus variegatus]XP_041472473.1 lysoplasmalogenase-like protein TMEM86A [Lytechinus variegatus]